MQALLATLWQSDSAFPSGGFAFSNGIEGAAALAGSLDKETLGTVLAFTLRHRWATADRHAMLHAFHADDIERLAIIDHTFETATLPEPLRVGSRRNGMAFLTAHARLDTPGAQDLRAAIAGGQCLGHLPVVQGWIWRRCGLDQNAAVAASAYTVTAAMVNAAVRLGLVGAIEAQRVLAGTFPLISDLAAMPFDLSADVAFPSATPWLDIAVTRHARSDLRLFSN
ncbi:urease accessory UreF family protein [Lichenihabitans sp. Uapishka_5]|uniref:urease accessory protein UreF n=1 Tax=Lichenihabitans sp. Uapishka_5 TaxID=3037302 RepID=UPI0029E7D7F7|nr:urease accessory UreF family protein [Lichenihabitans sp. Uapishka_5]MDX7950792.1 urease accessory UreF family protein [Lichenihabitans sp. Uapishka_5]